MGNVTLAAGQRAGENGKGSEQGAAPRFGTRRSTSWAKEQDGGAGSSRVTGFVRFRGMKERAEGMLKQRKHVFAVLLILFVWSGWLVLFAETRFPYLLQLAIDLADRTMPDSFGLLLQTFPRWKLVPLAVLTLIPILMFVRWDTSVLRILCAATLALLTLACVGMTFLATYGTLSGAEYFAEQLGRELP